MFPFERFTRHIRIGEVLSHLKQADKQKHLFLFNQLRLQYIGPQQYFSSEEWLGNSSRWYSFPEFFLYILLLSI